VDLSARHKHAISDEHAIDIKDQTSGWTEVNVRLQLVFNHLQKYKC
jgi:hypothetical protein